MNSKKLAVLSALALTLVLGLMIFSGSGSKAKAALAVCSVPSISYPTIQDAVNDGSCSVINVAPGSYFENVIIPRSLTLNGAQVGIDARGRAGSESIVNGANPIGSNPVISIRAADVRVDGFTLKNSITTNAAIGIGVKTAGDNAVITNNIFDGINTTDTGGNGTAQAVYLENGPDGVSITKNDMKNVSSARSAKGVTVGDASSANPSQNVLIQDNSISNVTSTTRGAYGVSINNGNGTHANTGLQILNNTIGGLNGGGWVHAIGLETDTPGVLVTGNSISNLSSPSSDAVAVWFEVNPSFSTASVNTNNLDVGPAAYGIAVHPSIAGTGSVDGTCNWWGAANGPGPVGTGNGSKVSLRVNYSPWSTSLEPGGECNGAVATSKDQCKNGGWQTLFRANGTFFKNQGDCIQYVNTGK